MALSKCKECGAEVSTLAASCPKCGAVKPAKRGSRWSYILGGFLLIGIIASAFKPSGNPGGTVAKRSVSAESANVEDKPSACASGDAERVYRMLQEMVVYDRNAEEPIFVHIRPDFWSALKDNPAQQKQLMESIANTDACLALKPRSIYLLNPDSKMIAKATPSTGIEMN